MDKPQGWIADVEITFIEGRADGVYIEGRLPAEHGLDLKGDPFSISTVLRYGTPDYCGDVFEPGCFDNFIAHKRKELGLDRGLSS